MQVRAESFRRGKCNEQGFCFKVLLSKCLLSNSFRERVRGTMGVKLVAG